MSKKSLIFNKKVVFFSINNNSNNTNILIKDLDNSIKNSNFNKKIYINNDNIFNSSIIHNNNNIINNK